MASYNDIIIARKRSLGQGNVFTPVCLLTGWRMMSFPVWRPGPMFILGVYDVTSCLVVWPHVPPGGEGFLCQEGVSVKRGLCQEGVSVMNPPPYVVVSGRYASYWNAFLFFVNNITDKQIVYRAPNYHKIARTFPKSSASPYSGNKRTLYAPAISLLSWRYIFGNEFSFSFHWYTW